MVLPNLIKLSDVLNRNSFAAILLVTLGACGFHDAYSDKTLPAQHSFASDRLELKDSGIVLVGTTKKTGLVAPVDNEQIAKEIKRQLAELYSIQSISPAEVREYLGGGVHDEMLAYYARHGRLAPHHLRKLMEANLPAPMALVVRLESNSLLNLPLERNKAMPLQENRRIGSEIHKLVSRREIEMSVKVFDLRTGREMHTRLYSQVDDTIFYKSYQAGSGFIDNNNNKSVNGVFNIANDDQYPLPATFFRSIVGAVTQAIEGLLLEW